MDESTCSAPLRGSPVRGLTRCQTGIRLGHRTIRQCLAGRGEVPVIHGDGRQSSPESSSSIANGAATRHVPSAAMPALENTAA